MSISVCIFLQACFENVLQLHVCVAAQIGLEFKYISVACMIGTRVHSNSCTHINMNSPTHADVRLALPAGVTDATSLVDQINQGESVEWVNMCIRTVGVGRLLPPFLV